MKKTIIKSVKGGLVQYVDYRKLTPFQGNLKELLDDNYKKIQKSFEEFGNIVPVFVWKSGSSLYLLDGHQRHKYWMTEGVQFEYEDSSLGFDVPCWMISAKDEEEAKKKLLIITSQFGTITQDGYAVFTAEIDADWLLESVNFDVVFAEEEEEGEEGDGDEDSDKNAKDISSSIETDFQVVVKCDSESEQEKVYNKLTKEGYTCQVLTL